MRAAFASASASARRSLRAAALRLVLALASFALLPLAAGCGGPFELPQETPGGVIPEKGSYAYTGSVRGITRPTDVLLTLGTGSTLYVVADSSTVLAYPRFFRPDGTTPPLTYVFTGTYKPTKICQGPSRLYVLEAGDTLLAQSDPSKAPGFHQFRLTGGDPVITVRDTGLAEVRGIASDASGNVYVSCIAREFIREDPQDSRLRTFKYVSRVYRYLASQGFARDPNFFVDDGQGTGIVSEPNDCFVRAYQGTLYLYIADTGKDLAQRMVVRDNAGAALESLPLDGGQTGATFVGPVDMVADDSGFMYICDRGNRRILRYNADGIYIQKVNIELDLDADSLHVPIAVSADDSLAYVADYETGKISSYKKRK
jgi:hypothetical protein